MKRLVLLLVVCLIVATVSAGPLALTGVNEAGAEFGSPGGAVNNNYVYPDLGASQHLHSLGMNIFRVPFLWERIQPSLSAGLSSAELGYLMTTVNNFTGSGSYVLLDPHNYAQYSSNLIGSSSVSIQNFANFWSLLAQNFKGNSRVIFGLMNEPCCGITTETWLQAANAAIAAIRQAGAQNLIFVPGNGYTGAHWWTTGGYGTANSQVMGGIQDPLKNFAFEVHQYFDSDYSGTHDSCQSSTIGSQVMASFTAWCRTNGFKAFVGEFAGGNNAVCQQCVSDFLTYLQSNNDVYLGFTWWSAGPWWGSYMFTLEPTNSNNQYTDQPQTAWLKPFLAGSNAVLPSSIHNSATVASQSSAAGVSAVPKSPNPSPSAQPKGPTSQAVYLDSLQGSWSSTRSWAKDYSFSSTDLAYAGQYSLKYRPSGYDGIYLTCADCFNTSFYGVYMKVNGGPSGGQKFSLAVRSNYNQVGNQLFYYAQANTWTTIQVALTSFGVNSPTTLNSLLIQDASNSNSNGYMYIDNIYILAQNTSGQVVLPPGKKRTQSAESSLAYALGVDGSLVTSVNDNGGSGSVLDVVGIPSRVASRTANVDTWINTFNSESGMSYGSSQVTSRILVADTDVTSQYPAESSSQGGTTTTTSSAISLSSWVNLF